MRGLVWLALLVAVPASAQHQELGDQNRFVRAPQANPKTATHPNALLFKDWREQLYARGIDPHLSLTTESSVSILGVSGALPSR